MEKLKKAFEEGILLLVKYGLIVAAIWYAFNYSLQTRQMAANGQSAALLLLEYQKKGYLPPVINGQVADKPTK